MLPNSEDAQSDNEEGVSIASAGVGSFRAGSGKAAMYSDEYCLSLLFQLTGIDTDGEERPIFVTARDGSTVGGT